MSKKITPGMMLDNDLVDKDFSYEISLSPDNVSTIITSSLPDSGVTLENGSNSAKVYGKYTSDIQFPISIVKYIQKGKSDKQVAPTVSDMKGTPPGQEILYTESDPKKIIIVTYTVVGTNATGATTTSTFTHTIMQDYSKMRDWLLNYMGYSIPEEK